MGVYEEREAFWRAGRRIWDGWAHFKLGWPTQTNSFKRLSRAAIAMMQPADVWNRDHLATVRWLNITCNWRVRYIRLIAKSEVAGNPWASVAELNVIAKQRAE